MAGKKPEKKTIPRVSADPKLSMSKAEDVSLLKEEPKKTSTSTKKASGKPYVSKMKLINQDINGWLSSKKTELDNVSTVGDLTAKLSSKNKAEVDAFRRKLKAAAGCGADQTVIVIKNDILANKRLKKGIYCRNKIPKESRSKRASCSTTAKANIKKDVEARGESFYEEVTAITPDGKSVTAKVPKYRCVAKKFRAPKNKGQDLNGNVIYEKLLPSKVNPISRVIAAAGAAKFHKVKDASGKLVEDSYTPDVITTKKQDGSVVTTIRNVGGKAIAYKARPLTEEQKKKMVLFKTNPVVNAIRDVGIRAVQTHIRDTVMNTQAYKTASKQKKAELRGKAMKEFMASYLKSQGLQDKLGKSSKLRTFVETELKGWNNVSVIDEAKVQSLFNGWKDKHNAKAKLIGKPESTADFKSFTTVTLPAPASTPAKKTTTKK